MTIVVGQPAPAPQVQHHGWLHNALADVKDATLGIIPGLAAIGGAGLHDLGHLAGITGGPYQLDNIGSALGKSYANYYGPLFQGHFAKFYQNVHDHPLELALDAGGLLTGGGTIVGKAGLKAAETAAAGSRLAELGARAAGLTHDAGATGAAAMHTGDVLEGINGHTIGLGGLVNQAGQHMIPRIPRLESSIGNADAALKTSTNPVIRARQAGLRAALSQIDKIGTAEGARLPTIPLVGAQGKLGSAARIGRKNAAASKRAKLIEASAASSAFAKALSGLNKHEKVALRSIASNYLPSQHAVYLEGQIANGTVPAWEVPARQLDIKAARHPKVAAIEAAYAAGKHPKLVEADRLARELSKWNTDQLAKAAGESHVSKIASMTPEEAQAELVRLQKEHVAAFGGKLGAIRESANPFHGLGRTRNGSAYTMNGGKSPDQIIQERAGHTKPKKLQVSSAQRRSQVDQHIEDLLRLHAGTIGLGDFQRWGERYANAGQAKQVLDLHHVTPADATAMVHRLDKIEHLKETLANVAHATTRDEAAAAAEWLPGKDLAPLAMSPASIAKRAAMEAEAVTGKPLPAGSNPAIFTHLSTAKRAPTASLKGASTKLGESKLNTGANFAMGRESRNPAVLIATTHRIAQANAIKAHLADIVNSAREVTIDQLRAHGDNYVGIPKDSPLLTNMKGAASLLDGPAAREYGKNSNELAAVKTHFDQLAAEGAAQNSGLVHAVPRAMWEAATAGMGPTGAVAAALDKGTNIWRSAVLPLRPAWHASNFAGQYGLGMLSSGPVGFLRGLVEQAGPKGAVLDKNASHLASTGRVHEAIMSAGETKGLVRKVLKGVPEASTKLNSYLTDSLPRRAVFLHALNPLVKKLQTLHPELSWEEAANRMLEHPDVVDQLTQKVVGDLVDFSNLSNSERVYIRRVIPFYSWIRGIAIRTGDLALNEPIKALALAKTSQLGLAQNAQLLGNLPSYVRGALPIGGPHNGYANVVNTQSLNPFATVADLGGQVESVFGQGQSQGGGNPLSQVNPLFKVPIEATTNTNAFTGQKVDKTGKLNIGQRAALDAIMQFPQVVTAGKAYGSTLQHTPIVGQAFTPPPAASLYKPSQLDSLLAYFLAPKKQVNLGRAHALAASEAARASGKGTFY